MRWRRSRESEEPGDGEDEVVAVACAYCDQGIDYTETDPISIGIVERWRPWDEAPDHSLYAHRECFLQTLHEEVRADVARWRPPTDRD